MKRAKEGLVDKNGAARREGGHKLLFAKTEGVKFGDGALLRKGGHGDFEFTQSAGRERTNVRTTSTSGERILRLGQIEEPPKILGEQNVCVWANNEKLASGDRGLIALEETGRHANAPGGQEHDAPLESRSNSRFGVELDQIEFTATDDAVFGKIADADQVMRASRVVP